MNCALCKNLITDYSPETHQLIIDENQIAEICSACIDKFVKWRQDVYVKLFPTKAAKKWSSISKKSI